MMQVPGHKNLVYIGLQARNFALEDLFQDWKSSKTFSISFYRASTGMEQEEAEKAMKNVRPMDL